MQAAYSDERKQRHRVQSELSDLKARIEELKHGEARLQKWEARKPAIHHYLTVVGEMAKSVSQRRPVADTDGEQGHGANEGTIISARLPYVRPQVHIRAR